MSLPKKPDLTRIFAAAAIACGLNLAHAEEGHEGHDHGKKEASEGHKGHDHGKKDADGGHNHDHDHDHGEAKKGGAGLTDFKTIKTALYENLACLDKELAAVNHDALHGCLEKIEDLGKDIQALKEPADPQKRKRAIGYAKNLGSMAHKVDSYMDAKQADKAKDQLKKLRAQVDILVKQFE